MYAITTTAGLVIESRPSGDTGRSLSILTKDAGLIRASAIGIRAERSKLRYHTQEFSFARFSFVRGKDAWRLTGAEQSWSVPAGSPRELMARLSFIARRFIHGEEHHQGIYDALEACGAFLVAQPGLSLVHMQALESLTAFRVLRGLGYIDDKGIFDDVSGDMVVTMATLDTVVLHQPDIIRHINRALRESQM